MARATIEDDAKVFVSALRKLRVRVGNGFLKTQLGWRDERYWRVHGLLREKGRIVPGRGRGGSVGLQ